MLDLEAQMAKALEGKFFWEHSRDPDEQMAPAEREIKAAQKKFRPKITNDKFNTTSLDERVNKVVQMVAAQKAMNGDDDPFILLRNAVGYAHNVNPALVSARDRNYTIMPSRHHYFWTCLRHFPSLSISEIARQIGRDHSTLFHSRDKWEKVKHKFMEEIEIVDRVMEKIKCG